MYPEVRMIFVKMTKYLKRISNSMLRCIRIIRKHKILRQTTVRNGIQYIIPPHLLLSQINRLFITILKIYRIALAHQRIPHLLINIGQIPYPVSISQLFPS